MIIRSARTANFTIINNAIIEDSELDWRDLGLLVFLLSRPDNWEISVEHLSRQKKLGRDGIYASLKVLINAGYVVRQKLADGNIKWTIYDDKNPNRENPEKATDSLIGKIPNRENPNRENPTLINTDNKQILIKQITNTDIGAIAPSVEKKRFEIPTINEIANHISILGYTVDAEAFHAHYSSNGWMVGKNKMKCWKSALVTWEKRPKQNYQKKAGFDFFEAAMKPF